jgi:hypothetical protein
MANVAKKLNYFFSKSRDFLSKKKVKSDGMCPFIFHIYEKFGTNMHWMQLSTKNPIS